MTGEQCFDNGCAGCEACCDDKDDLGVTPRVTMALLTDAEVERMTTDAGWDNKKYMTAGDYRQWCDMVRRLIGIYEGTYPVADLRDQLQQKCSEWGTYWRASDAHGVVLTHEQALELLRDALGVEVEFRPETVTDVILRLHREGYDDCVDDQDDEALCPECQGDGGDKWNDYCLPCPTCGGDGRLW